MADPKVINYAGEQKIYNKENVDELLDTKQDTLVPDVVVQDSVNVVTNSAVKAYVDTETQRAKSAEGGLADLKTTDKSNLVAAINEVKNSAYTVDEHVTAGSTNPVQNTGVKEYVDTQGATTLESAKRYTDDKIGELGPDDGSTVVELTGHLGNLKNAAESLVTAINNIDSRVEQNSLGIGTLEASLNQESAAHIAGDQALDTKITRVEQTKQDKLTFDDTPTHSSNNPVTSTGIKDYVDEITGQLDALNTPAESLVTAINQLDGKLKDPDWSGLISSTARLTSPDYYTVFTCPARGNITISITGSSSNVSINGTEIFPTGENNISTKYISTPVNKNDNIRVKSSEVNGYYYYIFVPYKIQ